MQRLIALDSKFFAYYEYLAEFYIKIGNLDKATETLTKALEVDDTYFKFYYLLGKIAHLQNNYPAAIAQFQRAYAINPLDLSSCCYLATLYNEAGKYENTAKLLDDFDLRHNNNDIGELVFGNKVVALLNTNVSMDILQALVARAGDLRPSSETMHKLNQELQSISEKKTPLSQ
jgi:tetratricopeptide (TPR) repeat protein